MRLQPRLGGADQDAPALLAADDLVGRGVAHAGLVAACEFDAAALAAALTQDRRADAAALLADLVVEGDEGGREVGGQGAGAGAAERLAPGGCGGGVVGALLGGGPGGAALLQRADDLVEGALRGLALLHQ